MSYVLCGIQYALKLFVIVLYHLYFVESERLISSGEIKNIINIRINIINVAARQICVCRNALNPITDMLTCV